MIAIHPAIRLCLVALAYAGVAAAQARAPDAALPEGIAPYAETRGACFLPGEMESLDSAVDAGRIVIDDCAAPVIAPEAEVRSARVYREGSNRVVDCGSLRRRMDATRHLDTFLTEFVTEAEDGDPVCAAGMLSTWARAGAMTRTAEDAGRTASRLAVMWTLGGLSAAYLADPEVRAAARTKGADLDVTRWFSTLAGPVVDDIRDKRARKDEDNIQYWRGFAILPTALLSGDAALLRESRATFAAGMHEITEGEADASRDGFLPLELERGRNALHYQAYAAHPLVAMAVVSEAHGCGFIDSGWKRRQIAALLARTVEGAARPEVFADEVERRIGKRFDMRRSRTARRSPDLLYLIGRVRPPLRERIDAMVIARIGTGVPDGAGSDGSLARLGGSYARMADAALAPRDAPEAGLAEICDP